MKDILRVPKTNILLGFLTGVGLLLADQLDLYGPAFIVAMFVIGIGGWQNYRGVLEDGEDENELAVILNLFIMAFLAIVTVMLPTLASAGF